MKRLLASLLLLSGLSSAPAQYAIDWSKIAGGGGTSTGGVYSLSSTLGQPEAGRPMTNGQYSVSGATNPVTVPATVPTKFYRLFKP